MIDYLKRRKLPTFEHIEPKLLKVVRQAFHPIHYKLGSVQRVGLVAPGSLTTSLLLLEDE